MTIAMTCDLDNIFGMEIVETGHTFADVYLLA